MSANSPKILIVGAGVTGSLCAFGLKRKLPHASISLLDKARGAGGRMSTTRIESGNKADLGAQYITSEKSSVDLYRTEYQSLLNRSVICPLDANIRGMKAFKENTVHFTAPGGMSEVVKHFLQESGCPVKFNCRVNEIIKQEESFQIKTDEGSKENYDIVISTIPVPQFLSLTALEYADPSIKKDLNSIIYSSRFSLIFFYDKDTEFCKEDVGTSYLDDDVFRFVSFDNVKRQQIEEPPSIVFHTNVQFGEDNRTIDKKDVEPILVARVKKLFPSLPSPAQIKCHKWLYSQVTQGFPNSPGCVLVNKKPMLILAGDAFSASNFNGCAASARAVVNKIQSEYGIEE